MKKIIKESLADWLTGSILDYLGKKEMRNDPEFNRVIQNHLSNIKKLAADIEAIDKKNSWGKYSKK